jgi:hypothetical protein
LIRSRDPAFRFRFILTRPRRCRCSANVEFENASNHDKILRAVAVLGPHEAKRLVAIDEKPAADAAWILDNPVSMTVAPDPKPWRLQA